MFGSLVNKRNLIINFEPLVQMISENIPLGMLIIFN